MGPLLLSETQPEGRSLHTPRNQVTAGSGRRPRFQVRAGGQGCGTRRGVCAGSVRPAGTRARWLRVGVSPRSLSRTGKLRCRGRGGTAEDT